MAISEELYRDATQRKFAFLNYCNMVPVHAIAEDNEWSVEETERAILFVGKKIREYRHQSCVRPAGLADWYDTPEFIAWKAAGGRRSGLPMPPPPLDLPPEKLMLRYIPCETLDDILVNREELAGTLEFLTTENLASELFVLPTLRTHAIESADNLVEAAHGVHARVTEK